VAVAAGTHPRRNHGAGWNREAVNKALELAAKLNGLSPPSLVGGSAMRPASLPPTVARQSTRTNTGYVQESHA